MHTSKLLTLSLSTLLACIALSQVRLYEVLFKSESPDALGDEWLTDLNPDSLQIIKGAFIPPHLAQTAKVGCLHPGSMLAAAGCLAFH